MAQGENTEFIGAGKTENWNVNELFLINRRPFRLLTLLDFQTMKKIPTVLLALAVGILLELLLLFVGGFDLRIGAEGPASMLLFITHMPAMFLCAVLPVAWQTETAIGVANSILIGGIAFVILALKRKRCTS